MRIYLSGPVSVPLSRLVFVNMEKLAGRWNPEQVSVPLSGLVFVNSESFPVTTATHSSFRPLIGVSFCKLVTIWMVD